MEVLSTGNNKSIKGNVEYATLKISTGLELRVLVDVETLEVKMHLDHSILAKCQQTDKCLPYVEVQGFYQD